jgi:excisionase family DNA binding protein
LEQDWSTISEKLSRTEHHVGIFGNVSIGAYTPFLPRLITMSIPYQPITKESAAALLAVSKRTVDNWIADGTIIAPSAIGRRVYWHPDAFFRWLDEKLGADRSRQPVLVRPPKRGRPRTNYPGQPIST